MRRVIEDYRQCVPVRMTDAQRERQDLQVAWLRLAIAAQERRSSLQLDVASLEQLKGNAPCHA